MEMNVLCLCMSFYVDMVVLNFRLVVAEFTVSSFGPAGLIITAVIAGHHLSPRR